MQDNLGVTYTLSAFKRAKFVGGDKHLLLEADQGDAVVFAALQEATNAVTDALYEYEARDEAYVSLDGPVPTPNGPMARVRDCEPAKALPLMLEALAADLSGRGITGRLVPAKTFYDAVFGNQSFPVLGMLLSPLNDTDAMYAAFEDWRVNQLRRGLWVDQHRHQRVVAQLVEWVTEVEGTILVAAGGATLEVGRNGLAEYMASALATRSWLAVSATSSDNRRRRQVGFSDSEVIVYDYDPDHPRRDQLAALTDLATRLAPELAYALIRELQTFTQSIDQCRSVPPTIRLFEHVTYTIMLKHLEPDYVFDVGVAQVLTSSQLAKTTLPAHIWTVQDLGADRHLVTHNDPDAWLHPDPHFVHREYTTLPPDWSDADFLATTRADFGPAIITIDTLRQHPPPLTREQIRTDPTLRTLGVPPP